MLTTEKFWAVTTFYNPSKYKTKLKNYKTFREKLSVPLCAVEISDGDFELGPQDADILLQFRGETCIWQKEAAINAAVKHLPPQCSQVAWVDADLIWENLDWGAQTSNLLLKHQIVQPFEWCFRMPQSAELDDFIGKPFPTADGPKESHQQKGFAAHLLSAGKEKLLSKYAAHVGFAWSARRSLLEQVGIYDYHVLGSGDTLLAYSSIGCNNPPLAKLPKFAAHVQKWRDLWRAQVEENIGYTPGRIIHLWHGNITDRLYHERHQILVENNFDPGVDIGRDKNGLLYWKNPVFKPLAQQHFNARKEDG